MKRLFLILLGLTTLLVTLNSCVSTETLEPESFISKGEQSNEIVLNLSAPIETQTRANGVDIHEGHTLRYVAKLYPLVNGSIDKAGMRRKEIIEKRDGNNQISFTIDPDSLYRVCIFADYIKTPAQNENGEFADLYYDTSSKDAVVTMKTTPGKDSYDMSQDFFNNDNYDCFSDTVYVKKGSKLTRNIELKRRVAKIEFFDTGEKSSDLTQVIFSNLQLYNDFQQEMDTYISTTTWPSKKSDSSFERKIEIVNLNSIKKPDDSSIIFFYSFADKYNESDFSKSFLMNLDFSTSIDSSSLKLGITVPKIEIAQNHKTKIYGNLSDPPTSGEPEDKDPSIDENNILNLYLTTEDWNQKELSSTIESN